MRSQKESTKIQQTRDYLYIEIERITGRREHDHNNLDTDIIQDTDHLR